jgi:homospermidine synthase
MNRIKLNTVETRLSELDKISNTSTEHFVIIGCGCMGRVLIYWINKFFVNSKITVIEKNAGLLNFVNIFNHESKSNVSSINIEITKRNYKKVLDDINNKTFIVDASYDISTIDIIKYCDENNLLYINSAIEHWADDIINPTPYQQTLDFRTKALLDLKLKNITALVTMGCNPGNVSLWVKLMIEYLSGHTVTDYAQAAKDLDIKTIHISEHDTQLSPIINKYVYQNTWSNNPRSWIEEANAPVEITLGTHEDKRIINNPTVYQQVGMKSLAYSYTPNGVFKGMLIRHEENLSIPRYLKSSDESYYPSTYYVYKPTRNCQLYTDNYDEKLSYHDTTINGGLMTTSITDGRDELGVTIFLKDKAYWCGSLLDIHEARRQYPSYMHPYINATNSQVVTGYLIGIFYLVNNRKSGLIFPENIDLDYMKYGFPLLGEFIIEEIIFDKRLKYNIESILVQDKNNKIYENIYNPIKNEVGK